MRLDLEPYLIAAQDELGLMPEETLFASGPSAYPRLSQYGVNHIVIYPGSFNPPHLGHLATLNHILEHQSLNMHVITGIVVPSEDPSPLPDQTNPCPGITSPISQKDRCALWRGDHRFPRNALTWHGLGPDLRRFCWRLFKVMALAGLRVTFVLLIEGRDMFTMAPYNEWRELCREIVASDLRWCIHRDENGAGGKRPARVAGFGGWVREVPKPQHRGWDLLAPSDYVWSCGAAGDPLRKLTLLCPCETDPEAPGKAVNSARIWSLVANDCDLDFLRGQDGVVLNKALFFHLIAALRPQMLPGKTVHWADTQPVFDISRNESTIQELERKLREMRKTLVNAARYVDSTRQW